jgi:hypothetical protein
MIRSGQARLKFPFPSTDPHSYVLCARYFLAKCFSKGVYEAPGLGKEIFQFASLDPVHMPLICRRRSARLGAATASPGRTWPAPMCLLISYLCFLCISIGIPLPVPALTRADPEARCFPKKNPADPGTAKILQ